MSDHQIDSDHELHTDHSKKPAEAGNHYAHWIIRRLVILFIVAFIVLIIGAMIGYRIGGGNPLRVFLPSTWAHIFDFLN